MIRSELGAVSQARSWCEQTPPPPASRKRATRFGSRSAGSGTGLAERSGSAASATIRPSRRAGAIATPHWVSMIELGMEHLAGQPHRLQGRPVVDAEDVGALADRERRRRDRAPLALARRQALLPRPGQ